MRVRHLASEDRRVFSRRWDGGAYSLHYLGPGGDVAAAGQGVGGGWAAFGSGLAA
jgi:hypothetical protein